MNSKADFAVSSYSGIGGKTDFGFWIIRNSLVLPAAIASGKVLILPVF